MGRVCPPIGFHFHISQDHVLDWRWKARNLVNSKCINYQLNNYNIYDKKMQNSLVNLHVKLDFIILSIVKEIYLNVLILILFFKFLTSEIVFSDNIG